MAAGLFCIPGYTEIGLDTYAYVTEILSAHHLPFYVMENQAHGIHEDINDFNYKLALAKAEKEYLSFMKDYDEVFLMGFSMGGAIASYLATRYGCDKLVLVSPAFKYGRTTQLLTDFLKTFGEDNQYPSILDLFKAKAGERKEIIRRYMQQEFADKGGAYFTMFDRLDKVKPTSFLNFTRLVATVKKELNLVDIPTRIYQSENDELIPVDSALWIFSKIKTEDKRLIFLSGPRHRILNSGVKEEITEDVIRFLYGLNLTLE
jgi:carboxylesterase